MVLIVVAEPAALPLVGITPTDLQSFHAELLANPEDVKVIEYSWLSDRTIALYGLDADDKHWPIQQLDVASRKIAPLPGDAGGRRYTPLRPSPDGTKLLVEIDGDGGQWVVSDINGRQIVKCKGAGVSWPSNVYWMPDGNGWAQMMGSVGGQTELHVFSVGNWATASKDGVKRVTYTLLGYPWMIGFLDARHLLVSRVRLPTAAADCDLAVYELGTDATEQRTTRFSFPNSLMWDVCLSPDKTRLCWLALQPIDARKPDSPDCIATFYVTDLAYKSKHVVGDIGLPGVSLSSVELLSNQPGTLPSIPWKLRWSPDGRRISYLHNRKLWAVDVPRDEPEKLSTPAHDGNRAAVPIGR